MLACVSMSLQSTWEIDERLSVVTILLKKYATLLITIDSLGNVSFAKPRYLCPDLSRMLFSRGYLSINALLQTCFIVDQHISRQSHLPPSSIKENSGRKAQESFRHALLQAIQNMNPNILND